MQCSSTPPPSPNLDNLYHFFLTPMCQIWQGSPPPHPQIDPIYTVCEKWTKNLGRALSPPPHFDKIQKNSYPFRETVPMNHQTCRQSKRMVTKMETLLMDHNPLGLAIPFFPKVVVDPFDKSPTMFFPQALLLSSRCSSPRTPGST